MKTKPIKGAQRLSVKKLHAWEKLEYGMYIHFGMSTFDGDELSRGDRPSTHYCPTKLDVDQWVSVARDAGMKYAILTAKHVSGHCLWPSKHTDYHVGTSSDTTNVVEEFVKACEKRGILPGLYYCSWDNHHTFGSISPTFTHWEGAFTTSEYRDFQMAQVEELLTQFGPVVEMWNPCTNRARQRRAAQTIRTGCRPPARRPDHDEQRIRRRYEADGRRHLAD